MLFKNVCIEAWGYELPPHVITSQAIEESLAPAYSKLNIPPGRLEMLSGIKERRWWESDMKPSEGAVKAVQKALATFDNFGHNREDIGVLVNASVCRDFLEPSTASVIHGKLGLSRDAEIFDVSNACLGFTNGLYAVATRIEVGAIKAGIVVSCESGQELVENTIREIVENPTQEMFMNSIASLTIGSGAVCFLLTHRDISKTGNKLVAIKSRNASAYHSLCKWEPDTGFPSTFHHSMKTDGKLVLEKGVELAAETWEAFKNLSGWTNQTPDRFFCHQVGILHRNQVFKTLGLNPEKDYTTLEYLGNTGSVAMPITLAIGLDQDQLKSGERGALLGIGSGLCCTMMGVEWA